MALYSFSKLLASDDTLVLSTIWKSISVDLSLSRSASSDRANYSFWLSTSLTLPTLTALHSSNDTSKFTLLALSQTLGTSLL